MIKHKVECMKCNFSEIGLSLYCHIASIGLDQGLDSELANSLDQDLDLYHRGQQVEAAVGSKLAQDLMVDLLWHNYIADRRDVMRKC